MTVRESEGSFGLVHRPGIAGDDTDLFFGGQAIERLDVSKQPEGRVALADLNILNQARSEYDPDGIRELALSMVRLDEDTLEVELLHPPIILEFTTPESLQEFLDDYDAFYGVTTDPRQLHISADGVVRVVDAGHRRSLAMKHIAETLDVDLANFTFPATIKTDVGFDEAVSDQVRENIHDRPPKSDEARMIERYYNYMSTGRARKPTLKQCAQALGLSERVVSEALRFAELPSEVQNEFKAGFISFENAVLLHRYMTVLRPYYTEKYRDAYRLTTSTVEADLRDALMTVVNGLKDSQISGGSAKDKTNYIRARIATIEETVLHGGGLFEMESTPTELRRTTTVALGKKAIRVANSVLGSLAATSEGRDMLAGFAADIETVLTGADKLSEGLDTLLVFEQSA